MVRTPCSASMGLGSVPSLETKTPPQDMLCSQKKNKRLANTYSPFGSQNPLLQEVLLNIPQAG